jgi:hypothetical protein
LLLLEVQLQPAAADAVKLRGSRQAALALLLLLGVAGPPALPAAYQALYIGMFMQ